MKKSVYLLLCAVAIICASAFILLTENWHVRADEASVSFTSDKIDGKFTGLKASILFDKDHPEQSKISATIDATSVATGFFLKNSHAKDALGVDKYPTIRFVSVSVVRAGNGYLAKGELTMKGAIKPSTIHFTFEEKGGKGVFKGDFRVIPKEYGINRDGTPPVVMVTLNVPVNK
jgi:polyisoprenoid-binding protein YceI